jgi:hypothetical protein
MTQPQSAVYRYIVKELAPTAQQPNETPLSIVCEPISVAGAPSHHGTVTLHLDAGTTPAEAEQIANTLQTKVKALFHVQTPIGGGQ